MQLWSASEERRVYTEGNATYTVLNVGGYVRGNGCSNEQQVSDCWKLIFVEKDMFDVNDININALIDETGAYVKLIMKCGWLQRTIVFDKEKVIYDVIENTLGIANKSILSEVYLSVNNNFNKQKVTISEYLNNEVVFLSLDGKSLENNPLSNEEIRMFFLKNEELSNDKLNVKVKSKKL